MSGFPANGSDSLLVVEWRRLGDAILSLPFIRGARDRHAVHVLCHPDSAPLFATALPADRIWTAIPPWTPAGARRLPSFIRILQSLRTLQPALAVCGWADARVEWVMRATGAPRRVGFPMTPVNYYACAVPWRRRHLRHGRWLSRLGVLAGGPLLTDPLIRNDPAQSHLDDWRQMAQALNLSLNTELPWLTPDPADLDPAVTAELVRLRAAGGPVWLVHPGAGSPAKQWGKLRFEALVKSFFIPNQIPCMLIQPPGDPPLEASGPLVAACAPPTLKALMALTAQADAVVGNDSALAHLAAALGRKVVPVFGPSDPALFAPFGNARNVVTGTPCACRPCMDRCLMRSRLCLDSIAPAAVAAVVRRVHGELVEAGRSRAEKTP